MDQRAYAQGRHRNDPLPVGGGTENVLRFSLCAILVETYKGNRYNRSEASLSRPDIDCTLPTVTETRNSRNTTKGSDLLLLVIRALPLEDRILGLPYFDNCQIKQKDTV